MTPPSITYPIYERICYPNDCLLRQRDLIDNKQSIKHYTNPDSLLIGRQTKRQEEKGEKCRYLSWFNPCQHHRGAGDRNGRIKVRKLQG